MILWFRFILTLIRGYLKGPIDPLAPYTTTFRSYPFWDSEFQYLNGSRYFSFCELCVNEVDVTNGYFKAFLKHKYIGCTVNKVANYYRPVKNLKKFEVTTLLLGWDEKYIYRRFQIHQDKKLKFEALYKITFVHKTQKITPQYVMKTMGFPETKSPELPEDLKYLNFRAKNH